MHATNLILALANRQRGDPALAGRLKAVAMQLLPPLLDAPRALGHFNEMYRRLGAEHFRAYLEERVTFSMLVRNGTAFAGASASEPRLFSLHQLKRAYCRCWMCACGAVALAYHPAVISQELLPLTNFLASVWRLVVKCMTALL